MEDKSELFTEISLAESATVQGGAQKVSFDWDIYFYILGSAYGVFGKDQVTQDMIEFAWESSFSFGDTRRSHNSKSSKK